ncbi:RNA methyltransferase substrate-binding domain-containing protein, partial [Streptomyces sp. SID3343]|uniref:RNA methyltransferase substrate-binding domain-containing protein n=1 Tax=Streptomyces sp. SID3343 TaxID=2690260 RepID=UPI0013BED06B
MASPELTSTRSPRVAAARRLAKRAFRARERLFLAEGPQAVREAVALPGVLRELYITIEVAERYPDLVTGAHDARVPVFTATDEVVAAISQTVTPQGVVALCRFVD